MKGKGYPIPDETRRQIVQLVSGGMTIKAASKEVGVSYDTGKRVMARDDSKDLELWNLACFGKSC